MWDEQVDDGPLRIGGKWSTARSVGDADAFESGLGTLDQLLEEHVVTARP